MKYTVRSGLPALVALVVFSSSPAYAGWGHLRGGSSGGSSGGYAVAYGSSGASSGGSSGYATAYGSSGYGSSGYASYGSSGLGSSGGSSGGPTLGERLRAHMAAKRARHAARRAARASSGTYYASSGGSSGGSSGSYTSTGGSSGTVYRTSYGSSGYSAPVSYGSSGTTSYGSTGSVYYGASKSTAPMATLASTVDHDEIHLTVSVPSQAKIYVNDKPTTSTGAVRQFVSRGLEEGKSYKFEVRAELQAADGEKLVETKTVSVSSGDRENLDFAFIAAQKPVETALTLNVPEGAKVTLAGNQTKAVGEHRTYRTNGLKPGEVWDGYQVEVSYQGEVKSQTVRLIGGDKLQLTFAFDALADKLAAR